MTDWENRSREERSLLNPAFCATLMWRAIRGYASSGGGSLSFEESFLFCRWCFIVRSGKGSPARRVRHWQCGSMKTPWRVGK